MLISLCGGANNRLSNVIFSPLPLYAQLFGIDWIYVRKKLFAKSVEKLPSQRDLDLRLDL